MADLTALIERLEKAVGPDRELDALIATAVGGYVYEKRGRDQKAWFYPVPATGSFRKDHYSLPRYSASIDAAVALATRLLPNWTADADLLNPPPMSDKYGVRLFNANGNWSNVEAQAATPALALVLATLRALEAKNA